MKALKSVIIIATCIFASCSNKDEAPAPVGPQLDYNQTELTIPFFTEGDSGLPTLKWNGEVGNLSVSSYISGINLDENNGVLTVKKYLAPGIHNVSVIATNSIGQSIVNLKINSEFKGSFDGGYNNDPTSEAVNDLLNLTFNADGSTILTTPSDSAPGTWTRDGDIVTAVYSINDGANFVTFEGTLTYNSSAAAKLKGFFYQGDQVVIGSEVGFIHVEMN